MAREKTCELRELELLSYWEAITFQTTQLKTKAKKKKTR